MARATAAWAAAAAVWAAATAAFAMARARVRKYAPYSTASSSQKPLMPEELTIDGGRGLAGGSEMGTGSKRDKDEGRA